MQLLERAAELAALRAVWPIVRAGHGRLAVLEGAAGNGKSALLSAAVEQAEASGLQVFRARGSELEQGFAFGAIRQLFETPLARVGPADRETLLAGAAAPAARVVDWSITPVNDSGSVGDFAVLHGLYWLMANLSQLKPVLLAVDDLHWVDPSSVRALTYLAHRIADLPVAIAVALRPDEPGTATAPLDELCAEPENLRIAVRPLGLQSVSSVVREAIPDADGEVCGACFAATAGNPFYLRELLFTLRAQSGGSSPAVDVGQVTVPLLGARVIRRIARLGRDAQLLAQSMAVLGEGARLDDAAALAGMDGVRAGELASHMQRIAVLAHADPVAFAHPLLRRSLYDTYSVAERDAVHLAAARRLREVAASPEAVAVHLAAVRPAGRSEIAAALRDAAGEALRRTAPQAAVRWLTRAVAERASQPARGALLHELGRVELAARDPAAIAHLQEASVLVDDPVTRGHIAVDLSSILLAAGQWQTGVTVLSDAITQLGVADQDLMVDLEAVRALARAFDPRMVAAFDADWQRLVALTSGAGWSARAIAVLLADIVMCRGGSVDEARSLVRDGLRDWQLFSEHDAGTWASSQALTALTLMDDDQQALHAIEELALRAAEAGALVGTLTAMGHRAWILTRQGDLAAAEADMRTCMDVSLENGMALFVVTGAMFLTDAMLERPSLDDIAATVEQFELTPDFLSTTGGAMLLETRGRLRARRGDRDGAIADFRACGAVYAPLGFGPPVSFWRSQLASVLPAWARDEALRLMEQELSLASATELARAHGIALRSAGLLMADDHGLDYLRESVARLDGTAARLELSRSLVEYGAALRRDGQRRQAREPLAAGLELAHRCGAERLVIRAREELSAAGSRPRRIVRTGVEALTASELRTARLVAQGRSNAEAAQALFVSLKTVETHLMHAYAKLGLAGPGARRRLADLLPL